MSAVTLHRDGHGGYATADGRWTVTPVEGLGAGANNNRGWSNGHKGWKVTDTTEQATLARYGNPAETIVDALWRARDIIAAHEEQGR